MADKRFLQAAFSRTVLLATVLLAPTAFAQGGPGGGHGGGPGGETAPNNLAVPGILIGGGPTLAFECGMPVYPQGMPLTGYPLDPGAYYYVQGVNPWQASCTTADTADVTAAWGDNLTGSARLKTNSPIRVEVGLLATNPTGFGMTGFDVFKLEPNALDRESAYGTPAIGSPETGFSSNPITPYSEVRVYDAEATLKIYERDTGAVITDGPASAEINATGRIVYGYNLRVTMAGTYVIEFTAPNVTIIGVDAGTVDGNTITLEITVTPGGSGHGGGRGGGGGA